MTLKLSQHCRVMGDHEGCPRENTLGTSRCECPCHAPAILTDERGVPIDKPRRADFTDDVSFMCAFYAYKDRVTDIANTAFAEAFAQAMRAKR